MDKINSALLFYFVALFLCLVAIFIESPNLELFSRPIIIPSLFYFYSSAVKGKINILFSVSILFFFIGEILYMISISDFFLLGLTCFLLPYFIIIYFFCQDFIYYLKKKKYEFNSISFYIILLLLFYLLYNVLSFINESSQLEFSLYISYGITLCIMSVLTFIIQYNFNNKTILFMVLMVACFLVSDVFFVFSTKLKDVIALEIINVLSQQISYLLFILYFISRTKQKVTS